MMCGKVKPATSNYDITMKDLESFYPGDNKHVSFDKVKIKRFNRTAPHVIIGSMDLFEEWGEDIEILGELYKMQGYEYRPTPYKIKNKLCDIIRDEKVFYPTLLDVTDAPRSCPIPPGEYKSHGYTNNFEDLPPVLESGEYMAQISFIRNEEVLNGAKVYVTLVNKAPIGVGK